MSPFTLIIKAIKAGVAVWMYFDAKDRGYRTISAVGWALGIFFLMIVFLPLYLHVRKKHPKIY